MYKKSTCNIAILIKFQYEVCSDEGLSSHFETLYYIYLTHEYSHILPESFFETTTIHRTHFFVQKFNFVSKMAEYNFQTFNQMNLWCNSHRICPCISNKQMRNSHKT